jgi:hypothetical protein
MINKVIALHLISQMIERTGSALMPGPVFKKSIILVWFYAMRKVLLPLQRTCLYATINLGPL